MKHRYGEAGLSLVELIVILGVAGIVSVLMGKVLSNAFTGMRSVKARDDIIWLRQSVKDHLDCAKTYAAASSCTSGNSYTLTDSQNVAIKQIGDWDVKPQVVCKFSGTNLIHDYLNIAVTRHTSFSNPKDLFTGGTYNSIKTATGNTTCTDPSTGNSVPCTVSTDLFGATTSLCNDYFVKLSGGTPECPAVDHTNSAAPGNTTYTTSYYSTRKDLGGNPACDSVTIEVPMIRDNSSTTYQQYCGGSSYPSPPYPAVSTGSYSNCLGYSLGADCPSGMIVSSVVMWCNLPWTYAPPTGTDNCTSNVYGYAQYSMMQSNGATPNGSWRGYCTEYYRNNCSPKPAYPVSVGGFPAAYVTCVKPL